MREYQASLEQARTTIQAVMAEVNRTVVIDPTDLRALTGAVVLGRHVILDGQPGTGKTMTANAFADAMGGSFSRIQGTPDLLPADITGQRIWHPGKAQFEFMRGPIFSNFVLADEINRQQPKTQSALLEAMGEGQVTIVGEQTRELDTPFVVIATQNPEELVQGTYPLPLANLDRFMVGMKSEQDKKTQLHVLLKDEHPYKTQQVVELDEVRAIQSVMPQIVVPELLMAEIIDLTDKIAKHNAIDSEESQWSGSRKNILIKKLARYNALVEGRETATMHDVIFAAHYVGHHRLAVNEDAIEDGITPHDVIDRIAA